MEHFKKFLILTDKELNIKECNPDFMQYIGRSGIRGLDEVVPPQDMMQLRNAVFAIDPGRQCLTCFRIRTEAGSLNWIAANVAKTDTPDEEIQIELSDIQSMKIQGTMAFYDKMTGLLNKQGITNYAQELMGRYPRKTFYFFLLDIDHFKMVNDTFGHMRGDEVIIDVAHIIRDVIGKRGTVGRIGGDEFMLVLENVQTEADLRLVLGEVRDAVREKYENFGDKLNLTVSMGGARFPDYTESYEEMFNLADRMLYLAKMKGRDRYIFYTPAIHGPVHEDEKMSSASHRAAGESEKTRLLMDCITQACRGNLSAEKDSIKQMMGLFDLDAVYLFQGEDTDSTFGLERCSGAAGDNLREAKVSMPNLHSKEILSQIGSNQIAVINIYDLSKELYSDLITYMDAQGCRVMVIYHLRDSKKGGYIVYINRTDSACRLSEADLSDLTYYSHLFELFW
ncbi:MAG: GGDEF domain-containing protein [Lachnospiraceae bacterium]|nr:GGDEF domain-containing protein [Lachnospiraceae bacterium]MBO6209044.1 GGDEF domain-containing protein [Lachnospiraceae bacterium]